MVGSSSILMRMSYGLLPSPTRGIESAVINAHLNQAKNITPTYGNVGNNVDYRHSIHDE